MLHYVFLGWLVGWLAGNLVPMLSLHCLRHHRILLTEERFVSYTCSKKNVHLFLAMYIITKQTGWINLMIIVKSPVSVAHLRPLNSLKGNFCVSCMPMFTCPFKFYCKTKTLSMILQNNI